MVKKLCLAVGAVIVGLAVISFTGVGSLLQVKWDETRSWMHHQVPPETQLKQLRVESQKIDKDIKKNIGKVAVLEVQKNTLEKEVNGLKEDQVKQRADIAAMSKSLDSNDTKVAFRERLYSKTELARQLDMAVNSYEGRKKELAGKAQLLESKQRSVELAHDQIQKMKDQQIQLEATIAQLETRIQMMRMKQVDTPIETNDTQVSKCNAMAAELDKLLSEEETKTDLYHRYGYDTKSSVLETQPKKTPEEVRQSALKAIQDDDDKVVESKK